MREPMTPEEVAGASKNQHGRMMKSWAALASIYLGLLLTVTGDEVGASWRRVDDAQADRLSSVCWDGPVIVGVGSRGLVATSIDGKSWVPRFNGVHGDLKEVVWSGSHFVAVGSNGSILRSGNGTDWQRMKVPGDYNYSGLTWTGSQFIALDSFHHLSTSADGVTWNRFQITSMSGNGIHHFEGATYIRNGSGISRSTDLVTWTQVLSMSANNLPATIRKLNGRLFAVGPRNAIWSSNDGITWSSGTLEGITFPPQDLRDIAWNGTCYVAVGSTNRVWRSEDGLAWGTENALMADPAFVKGINGEFVMGDSVRGIQTSPDGREWTSARNNQRSAAVWTGDRYIIVGSYGLISTSPDLELWTSQVSGTLSSLGSVVWTGSFALASGADGVILKSDDGLAWSPVPETGFTGTVRLAWTGSQIFAFSSSGTHTSTDGTTWNHISTAVASQLTDVKWLRNMFVGIGFTGGIQTSPDGVVWTQRQSGTTSFLYAVAASDDEFLVGGSGGALLASPDGIEWTPRTPPVSAISALEHRFGRWILATPSGIHHSEDGLSWSAVLGLGQTSGLVQLLWTGSELVCTGLNARTSDGINWTQQTKPNTPPDFNAVAKGSGGFVAVGAGGTIWHSPDGYSWQATTSPTGNALVALASGSGGWVAAGSGGVIVTSPDGIHWTLQSSGTTANLRDIAWNGRVFAAVGESGTLLTSSDGRNWTAEPTGSTAAIMNIEAAGLAFKAFAAAGLRFESADGITWSSTRPDLIADVVWNGTSYVALGHGTSGAWAYVSSPDALEWARYPIGTYAFVSAICWTGTQHVACGSNGTIMTSPDGVNWTPRASGTTEWIRAVNWNGTQLVAVGGGGTILVSLDGVMWSKRTAPGGTSHSYQDVAWADGRYVAVARNNASATSTDGLTWQAMGGGPGGAAYAVKRVGSRFLAGGNPFYSAASTQWQHEQSSGLAWTATVHDFEWNGSHLFAATSEGVYRFQESGIRIWSGSRVHASPWLDSFARRDDEIVATGHHGTVVLSRDGVEWKNVQGGRDQAFAAVAWNGNHLVGVGSNQLLISPDGATWNLSTLPSPLTLQEVIWTGARFLAIGPNRLLLSTPDAEGWTVFDRAASPAGINKVAGDEGFLVAVGAAGMIAVSDGMGESAEDYQSWITAQGVESVRAAPLQDANSDGISNLMAYMFGIPAGGAVTPEERSALPVLSLAADGSPVLTFELRESYRPGSTYLIEVSSDMQPHNWENLQTYSAGWASGPNRASVTELELPGGGIRISVANIPDFEIGRSCFFRLRFLLP